MSDAEAFEVLGGERIGEKAEMLREHAPLVREAGLQIPPTTIIAHEAFEKESPSLGGFVTRAVHNNGEAPIAAVRSSGEGDARGSGVYDSIFSLNAPGPIQKVIGRVLDGFTDEGAEEFRRQVGLGDEFAIIIHPLIGQDLSASLSVYAPPLSGFGYSSTAQKKDGFINVVAGFGGGLSRTGGERISPDDADSVALPFSFSKLIQTRRQAQRAGKDLPPSDFRPEDAGAQARDLGPVAGEAFRLTEDPLPVSNDLWRHTSDSPLRKAMDLFEPVRFIERLQKMEQAAGYPVYVEWAVTTDGESLAPYIVQIAPMEKQLSLEADSEPLKEVYYSANGVIGTGRKKSTRIVACTDGADLGHLREFNDDPDNEGYILIYYSDLSTTASDGPKIEFRDFYRASVILEWQDEIRSHVLAPIEHHKGAIDLSGKFFGVIDVEKSKGLDELGFSPWRSSAGAGEKRGKIRIAEGDFTVAVDEMNDSLVVGKI
ncbi:MAG TPA: hypothetical protein VFX86_03465 [Candidatus Saccharimonadales bacterium]|nr:hypothetical protein [Candidatus Saccharimonadales bacterium]